MKMFTMLILIVMLSQNITVGQNHPPFMQGEMRKGRIAELEKIKLIETLDLDEETTLRFFSRRNEYLDNQKEIMEARKESLEMLQSTFQEEDNLDDAEYMQRVKEVYKFEKKLLEKRGEFIDSLTDILTPKQIAQLTVFEFRFMREIRNAMKRGRGRRK